MAAMSETSLREPLLPDQGLALWLARPSDAGFRKWERIRSTPRSEFAVQPGVVAAPATLIRARQPLPSFFGKLRQIVRSTSAAQTWTLPNGTTAEQYGERQSDVLLVWAEGDNIQLNEASLRTHWPQASRIEEIDKNLFLVVGVEPDDDRVAELAGTEGCPHRQAEKALAAARQQGDRRAEAAALTDLALIEVNQKHHSRAVQLFEEALGIARLLNDRALEGDILAGLGKAVLLTKHAREALIHLQSALATARELGDRFLEKLALEHLGHAHRALGVRERCLGAYHEALSIARDVGHRLHEAAILWLLAITHAELGERDDAIGNAQAAVEVLQRAGNPQAPWYAEQLRRYRVGDTGGGLAIFSQVAHDELFFGDMMVGAGAWTPPAGNSPHPSRPSQGPGLLRMAMSATQAMMKFLGSGLKTVSRSELESRLRTCAACPHHTGLRCRLCGCFTNTKARLPYEECPVGKW